MYERMRVQGRCMFIHDCLQIKCGVVVQGWLETHIIKVENVWMSKGFVRFRQDFEPDAQTLDSVQAREFLLWQFLDHVRRGVIIFGTAVNCAVPAFLCSFVGKRSGGCREVGGSQDVRTSQVKSTKE